MERSAATVDSMLVVVFESEPKAYEGKKALLQLESEGSIFLLGQHPFGLVVSARPVTQQGPLMGLLRRAPERFVFYSFLVEEGCLWFQALPEVIDGPPMSALRPSEFTSLDNIVKSQGESHDYRSYGNTESSGRA